MNILESIDDQYKKSKTIDIRSGDTVKVHQKVKEGDKERSQIFEGLVIKSRRPNSLSASITVRKESGGIGVEKTFPIHSTTITQIEVTKKSKVRRNYLSYLQDRKGRAGRLVAIHGTEVLEMSEPEPEPEAKPEKEEPDHPEENKEEPEAKESEEKESKNEKTEDKDTKEDKK